MNDLSLGWQLMGFGLTGVFTALVLFIAAVRLIARLFPYRKPPETGEDYRYDK